MTEEQKLHEELQKAGQAQDLLNNPLLRSSLQQIEEQILRAMAATPTHERDKVQAVHALYVASQKFKNTLLAMIETGKLASLWLEEKRKFKLWSNTR